MDKNFKKWPLGLTKSSMPIFLLFASAILIALTFIDLSITRWVTGLDEIITAPFKIITRAGNSDWILIPTLIGAIVGLILLKIKMAKKMWVKSQFLFISSAYIFTSVALPGIVANLIKRLIGRARPMNIEELGIFKFDPIINGWTSQSFPSGDATTIFALFVALTFLMPKLKYLFLLGAILVALSRIMVGVHFPSDVFGGILLGIFGAYAVRNYFIKKGWLE